MRFLKTCFIGLSVILFTTISLNAATLTIDIEGLDQIMPDNIWSYQLNFSITGEDDGIDVIFNEKTQHQWLVAPGVSISNWDLQSNVNENTYELVILGTNNADRFKSPLVDGNLFKINYGEQTSLDLVFCSFLSEETYTDVIPLFKNFNEATNTLTLSTTVPIPSTLLLLGGGFVALIGGTRRKVGRN